MKQQGISKLDLKRQNRMQILRLIQREGCSSRIDIAATLALTRAAVTIITNEMIEQGILYEMGEQKYNFNEPIPKGRKKILLGLRANYRFVFGVSIEKFQVVSGISTLAGEVLDKYVMPDTKEPSKENILKFIKSSYRKLLTANCLTDDQLLGIGAVVSDDMLPMFCDEDGVSLHGLENELSSMCKLPSVCSLLSEGISMEFNRRFRNKKEDFLTESMTVLCFGEPFHLVNYEDRRRVCLPQNLSTGISDLVLRPQGFCLDGHTPGSLGAELSDNAMAAKAAKVYSADKTPALFRITKGDASAITWKNMLQAAEEGDEKIAKLCKEAEDLLIILIRNLMLSIEPEYLALQGFPFSTAKQKEFLKEIEAEYGKPFSQRITFCNLDEKHNFLGACHLVIEDYFYLKGGMTNKK